ncbi:MAG TPA: TIGR02588 family protein [Longimicrobiaceae bacterium]|nr:TIGR02588 family protein [Longimicrobiaceae bacterium]
MGGERDRSGEGGRQKNRTSRWEWVAAAVGTLLVAGTIGYMLNEALTAGGMPPGVAVHVDEIVPMETGFLVRIRAENSGGETAAGLTVEGELRSDTGSVEKSQVTIDYVPARGSRFGGLIFQEDPRSYALTVRPMGYDRP